MDPTNKVSSSFLSLNKILYKWIKLITETNAGIICQLASKFVEFQINNTVFTIFNLRIMNIFINRILGIRKIEFIHSIDSVQKVNWTMIVTRDIANHHESIFFLIRQTFKLIFSYKFLKSSIPNGTIK